jgi:hypothetical protein
MRLRLFVALLVTVLSTSICARGDTIYTFTITGVPGLPSLIGSYIFYEPSILMSETTISGANIISSGPVVKDIVIDPLANVCPVITFGSDASCLQIDFASGQTIAQGFAVPLNVTGTYIGAANMLVITQNAVPEPSSLALIGTGLLCAVGAIRNKTCQYVQRRKDPIRAQCSESAEAMTGHRVSSSTSC